MHSPYFQSNYIKLKPGFATYLDQFDTFARCVSKAHRRYMYFRQYYSSQIVYDRCAEWGLAAFFVRYAAP